MIKSMIKIRIKIRIRKGQVSIEAGHGPRASCLGIELGGEVSLSQIG